MSDLQYAQVVGRFGITRGDGADGDEYPDTVYCDEGVVVFTPQIKTVKVIPDVGAPVTLVNNPIVAYIGTDGWVTYDGDPHVWLVDLGIEGSTNPFVPREQAAYSVQFQNVKCEGQAVTLPTFGFNPVAGEINDLTLMAPLATGPGGQALLLGPQGVGIADANVDGGGHLLLTKTDATVVDAGELPVGPGGSDAGVAGYITTPGTATEVALTATYAARPNAQRDVGFGDPQHEDETTYTYPTRIDFGAIEPAPPVVGGPAQRGLDVIAHWYNDFGLEYTASSASSENGWYGWYDWQWNFPSDPDYDPQRHPLQGFYQGDDATVLDWQAKWLAEAGVTAVNLANTLDTTNWTDPSSAHHWKYQLLTACPNFKALRYIMWTAHTGTSVEIAAQAAQVVSVYNTYRNGYTHTEGRKNYAVVFLWDSEALRGALDSYVGYANTVTHLKSLASQFQAIGYDGVCVLARNAGQVYSNYDSTDLYDSGVLFLSASYSTAYGDDTSDYGNDFADYAATAPFPTGTREIPVVQTARKTQSPHPSTFDLPGSTPELFGLALRRAADSVVAHGQRRMLCINNVSEWAESGPGLLPNIVDGFGYLDQVRALPTYSSADFAGPVSQSETLVSRTTLAASASSVVLTVPSWAKRIRVTFSGSGTSAHNLLARFNGDATAIYDTQRLTIDNTTATATQVLAGTEALVGTVSDSTTFSGQVSIFIDQSATAFQRCWTAEGYRRASGSATRTCHGGTWRNAAAITSVTLLPGAGSFRSGSSFAVYASR